MDSLQSHPSTAQQAKAFTSAASLSFPNASQFTGSSEAPSSQMSDGAQQNGNPASNVVTPEKVDGSAAAAAANGQGGVSGIIPTLQNIVATVNLDCRLDLKTIALHARNAEYNPKVR